MSRDVNVGARHATTDAADEARARAELARAIRSATLGQAIASVAHEIRQPLAAMVTNGNAALRWLRGETPNVAEAKLAIERIVSEGHRAAQAVQNIRAMLERKASPAEPIDVNAAVREVVALLDNELTTHGVTVATDLAAGLPPAPIDRLQLQQVVSNLAMNAIEAMEAVTETARVLRIASRPCGADVMLTVEDCGTGIAAENVDRVFTPFFTTKSHALGLGLTICRSIVEAQGGRLHATPVVPRGTAVHVVLVAVKPDGDSEAGR